LSRESGADREYCRSRHRNPSMMHAYPRIHALCGGVMGGLSIKATCGGVIGGLSNIAKAELAIAQPAIKATRLTFIMNAPNLSC
jgi:hypothetical protein